MAAKKKITLSFDEAYERLSEISNKLNDGDISLDEMIALYKESKDLIDICKAKVQEAELLIEDITNG